jgi:hypothetical protein
LPMARDEDEAVAARLVHGRFTLQRQHECKAIQAMCVWRATAGQPFWSGELGVVAAVFPVELLGLGPGRFVFRDAERVEVH